MVEKTSRYAKSATDMARSNLAEQYNDKLRTENEEKAKGIRSEIDYLETLSRELITAIAYMRGLEVVGEKCQQRKTTIDFLISADSEIHTQLIELKRTLIKLESD